MRRSPGIANKLSLCKFEILADSGVWILEPLRMILLIKFDFRLAGILMLVTMAASSIAAEKPDFIKDVRPVLEKHCFVCHGPEKQKGKVRLDQLSADVLHDAVAAETWHDALDVISIGEMPPDDEPPLTQAERGILTGWMRSALDEAIAVRKSTGGNIVMRRLNRVEYQNTMRDLLGLELDFNRDLPPEGLSKEGFKNNGGILQMSALQLEYYLDAARKALEVAVVAEKDAPEVIHHVAVKTEEDKGKGNWSNRLGRSGTFVGRLLKFPEQGEFVIRVKAHAELVEGKGFPRMKVMLGYRADTQTPSREVGVIDVSSAQPQVYEFRGRMESYPLQSKTQSKYPGMLIWLTNVYDDGGKPLTATKLIAQKGKKKKKKTKVWVEDPEFPKIVIDSFELDGPVFQHWPPAHHTDILIGTENQKNGNDESYVREILQRFMSRAYRRPVEDQEIELMLTFFKKVRPTFDVFEEAVRETLAMVLISPDFLYLIEPSGNNKRQLKEYELASRLSYFLWSSMPDAELFELAKTGELSKPEVLRVQVDRMLEDPRSWQFVENFTDQWLDLNGMDRIAVNPEFYPDFDNGLKPEMRRETHHFFAEVLKNNLSALNFLNSNFVMLNEPLARHYGLNGPRGTAFRKMELEPDQGRGGLLAQASVLLGNSTGEDSHPIKRAVWIRERLLDDPPAPPPPNVPALDSENPDFASLSIQEQMKIHREDPACADCHRGIDPWGLAMEEFDAVGLLRKEIQRRNPKGKGMIRLPVQSGGTLPGGHQVEGLDDLKAFLLEQRSEQFARALVSKMFSYSLGRSLEFSDDEIVKELASEFIQNDYQLSSLIHSITASENFQSK